MKRLVTYLTLITLAFQTSGQTNAENPKAEAPEIREKSEAETKAPRFGYGMRLGKLSGKFGPFEHFYEALTFDCQDRNHTNWLIVNTQVEHPWPPDKNHTVPEKTVIHTTYEPSVTAVKTGGWDITFAGYEPPPAVTNAPTLPPGTPTNSVDAGPHTNVVSLGQTNEVEKVGYVLVQNGTNWLELLSKLAGEGTNQGVHWTNTTITLTREPVVKAGTNGTWTITFPETVGQFEHVTTVGAANVQSGQMFLVGARYGGAVARRNPDMEDTQAIADAAARHFAQDNQKK